MAATSSNLSKLTRCHAPPAFSPLIAVRPIALSRYAETRRGRTGATRGRSDPRDPAGIGSGATLAWMPVVYTRPHQQAAGS
jgi:hypothetical protein